VRLIPVLVIFWFLATGAFAEDAAPAPTPAPVTTPAAPAAPVKYYLEVDAADLDALSKAIADLPFKVANPLLLKLNGQLKIQDQLREAADKALADPVEKAKKRK